MSNISFDNPWLLLAGIPMLLVVAVPFLVAVRRQNANLHNVGAFVCQILVVAAATLALAGMKYDATVTETNVYVLADVSYSTNGNLDVLDGYVRDVQKQLPKNSKMALVAFGRNYQVLSNLGEEIVSVRTADEVDDSGTDIAGALRYVGALFDDDVIKHIVVITDGKETAGNNSITAEVGKLEDAGVYIDVVYLNDNLTDDCREIQLTDVTYTASAFVGRSETAELEIFCNNDGQTHIYIDVECGAEKASYAQTLYRGVNRVSVPLDTETAGSFAYTVTVRPEQSADDTSPYNNSCLFTQVLSDDVRVLFIGGSEIDCAAGRRIYGADNVRYVWDPEEVPFTVEELCTYDEIVLCNFDVRTMLSSQQFVSGLNTVVSKFGKTLTTYGNTFVQEDGEERDASLDSLSGMLPVTVGNANRDARYVVILLDVSLSTNESSRLETIRNVLKLIVESLDVNDKVHLIGFSNGNTLLFSGSLWDKSIIYDKVDSSSTNGTTYLQGGLEKAQEAFRGQSLHNQELIIISDGLFITEVGKAENPCLTIAEELSASNVVLSAISVYSGTQDQEYRNFLSGLVRNKNANGKGYFQEITNPSELEVILREIEEQTDQVRIEGDRYEVTLRRPQEDLLSGVSSLSSIGGFWYGTEKTGAVCVVSVKHYRDKLHADDLPLFAYWSYGSGRVASFLSDISDAWTSSWTGENETTFLSNIGGAMLPTERIELPFLVSCEPDGDSTRITVSTPSYHKSATMTVTLTRPDGSQITRTMLYDSEQYVCDLTTDQPGRYEIGIVYDYNTQHYELARHFAISRYAEYDCLADYTVASLYRIVSENGEVSQDGTLAMDHADSAVRTYTYPFLIPLMIACAAFFLLGVMIRLIRLKDLRSFFSRRNGKRGNAA